MSKLTGTKAIEAAEKNMGIVLCKYADPVDDAREGLSIDDAREIVAIDPNLVWCEVPASEDPEYDALAWAETIVEEMNDDDRAAIRAAGNAEAWREGVAALVYDEAELGQRPALDMTLASIALLVIEKRVGERIGSRRVVLSNTKPINFPWEEYALRYEIEDDRYQPVTRGGHGHLNTFVRDASDGRGLGVNGGSGYHKR